MEAVASLSQGRTAAAQHGLFTHKSVPVIFEQPCISWCSLFINRLTIILFHDGINHILYGISSRPMAVLVQFNGRLLISVVGSKIVNKFLITFICFIYISGFLCFLFWVGDWMK